MQSTKKKRIKQRPPWFRTSFLLCFQKLVNGFVTVWVLGFLILSALKSWFLKNWGNENWLKKFRFYQSLPTHNSAGQNPSKVTRVNRTTLWVGSGFLLEVNMALGSSLVKVHDILYNPKKYLVVRSTALWRSMMIFLVAELSHSILQAKKNVVFGYRDLLCGSSLCLHLL